jgi:hypothetical protein
MAEWWLRSSASISMVEQLPRLIQMILGGETLEDGKLAEIGIAADNCVALLAGELPHSPVSRFMEA